MCILPLVGADSVLIRTGFSLLCKQNFYWHPMRLRLGKLDPIIVVGRASSQHQDLSMDKEQGVGLVVGFQKYGRVVPLSGYARFKEGVCKDGRLCIHLLPDGPCACFSLKAFFQAVTPQGHHSSRSHGTIQAFTPAEHLHALVSHHVNARLQQSMGNPVSSISISGWVGSPILPRDTMFPLKIPAFLGRASTMNCSKYVRVGDTACIVRGLPKTTHPN